MLLALALRQDPKLSNWAWQANCCCPFLDSMFAVFSSVIGCLFPPKRPPLFFKSGREKNNIFGEYEKKYKLFYFKRKREITQSVSKHHTSSNSQCSWGDIWKESSSRTWSSSWCCGWGRCWCLVGGRLSRSWMWSLRRPRAWHTWWFRGSSSSSKSSPTSSSSASTTSWHFLSNLFFKKFVRKWEFMLKRSYLFTFCLFLIGFCFFFFYFALKPSNQKKKKFFFSLILLSRFPTLIAQHTKKYWRFPNCSLLSYSPIFFFFLKSDSQKIFGVPFFSFFSNFEAEVNIIKKRWKFHQTRRKQRKWTNLSLWRKTSFSSIIL